jgi:hypothetical protein
VNRSNRAASLTSVWLSLFWNRSSITSGSMWGLPCSCNDFAFLSYWPLHLPNCQRGDTGQKPKHTPFCMKDATTHTLLCQIGPNLALNYWCWLFKLLEHVLRFDKSPCVHNDRTKSTRRAPVP